MVYSSLRVEHTRKVLVLKKCVEVSLSHLTRELEIKRILSVVKIGRHASHCKDSDAVQPAWTRAGSTCSLESKPFCIHLTRTETFQCWQFHQPFGLRTGSAAPMLSSLCLWSWVSVAIGMNVVFSPLILVFGPQLVKWLSSPVGPRSRTMAIWRYTSSPFDATPTFQASAQWRFPGRMFGSSQTKRAMVRGLGGLQ